MKWRDLLKARKYMAEVGPKLLSSKSKSGDLKARVTEKVLLAGQSRRELQTHLARFMNQEQLVILEKIQIAPRRA